MASPMPIASTKETTNYARLCRLLVDVGSHALRDTFDKIHPPGGLHAVLSRNPARAKLQSLRKKKILNPTQWGNLYPTFASSVSSASFDITLLIVLLRNICGLRPPHTGWDSLPPAADSSTEANIARVKHFRNTVYAHVSKASVDDKSFNTYWQDISDALVALGGADYEAIIQTLKHECMDPDMENHYKELLKSWKKDEDSIKDKLEEMEVAVTETLARIEEKLDTESLARQRMEKKLDTLTEASNKGEEITGHVHRVSEKPNTSNPASQDEYQETSGALINTSGTGEQSPSNGLSSTGDQNSDALNREEEQLDQRYLNEGIPCEVQSMQEHHSPHQNPEGEVSAEYNHCKEMQCLYSTDAAEVPQTAPQDHSKEMQREHCPSNPSQTGSQDLSEEVQLQQSFDVGNPPQPQPRDQFKEINIQHSIYAAKPSRKKPQDKAKENQLHLCIDGDIPPQTEPQDPPEDIQLQYSLDVTNPSQTEGVDHSEGMQPRHSRDVDNPFQTDPQDQPKETQPPHPLDVTREPQDLSEGIQLQHTLEVAKPQQTEPQNLSEQIQLQHPPEIAKPQQTNPQDLSKETQTKPSHDVVNPPQMEPQDHSETAQLQNPLEVAKPQQTGPEYLSDEIQLQHPPEVAKPQQTEPEYLFKDTQPQHSLDVVNSPQIEPQDQSEVTQLQNPLEVAKPQQTEPRDLSEEIQLQHPPEVAKPQQTEPEDLFKDTQPQHSLDVVNPPQIEPQDHFEATQLQNPLEVAKQHKTEAQDLSKQTKPQHSRDHSEEIQSQHFLEITSPSQTECQTDPSQMPLSQEYQEDQGQLDQGYQPVRDAHKEKQLQERPLNTTPQTQNILRGEDEEEVEATGEYVPGAVNHYNKTGRTNLGTDDHDVTSDNYSHGGHQQTDWKKIADESLEDYLSRCPGAYGGNEGSTSKWQASKERVRSTNMPLYVFHLYLDLDKKVESVAILTELPDCNASITFPLDRCSDDGKYWMSRHHINPKTFRYRYVVKYKKEGFGQRLYNVIVKEKDKTTLKETFYRKLQKGMHQYGIFQDPNETYDNKMRSVFLGHLFFVEQLYLKLENGFDPNEMLTECENVGFGSLNYQTEELAYFFRWTVEVINRNPSPYQGVYICSLLGQLARRMSMSAQRICYTLGKEATDKLLSSLELCSGKQVPHSSKEFIKVVAEDLFKAGSSKGCLAFINLFCNFLDASYAMQVADKFSSQPYSEEQFNQELTNVLGSLSILEDFESRRKFSLYIMKLSPSVQCLWNLYQVMSHNLTSLLQSITDEFAILYCKFISLSRSRKPDLLQSSFWPQVPDNLKKKLANSFCKALTEQISSETTWSEGRLSCLKSIALDKRLQVSDHFSLFISRVATHACIEVVSIMEDILESETFFFDYWNARMSKKDKEAVCLNWLTVHFHPAGKKPKEQILGVVEACESLCGTYALKKDQALCLDVKKEVEGLVLKEKFQSIVDAFEDAQNCGPAIQQHLMMLLKSAIKLQSSTGDRRSRYRQIIRLLGCDFSQEKRTDLPKVKLDSAREELLLAILDIIQTPFEAETDLKKEQIFKAMLFTSDVWLPLLSAIHSQSILLKHASVKVVIDALHWLATPEQRHHLRLVFLQSLNNEELRLLATFCALVLSKESTIKQNDVDEWIVQFSLERADAQNFCELFPKLEHTIRFIQDVSKGIVAVSDADSLIHELNNRKKVKDNTTLKDVLDVKYWEALHELIACEKTATEVPHCVVFFNVARMCLKEEFATGQAAATKAVDTLDDLPESKAADILHLLKTKGLQQFKQECDYMLDSRKDPSTEKVGRLLSGIANENALHEELKVITSSCGGLEVSKERKKMLISYLHFPRICERVEQLMSFFSALGFHDAEGSTTTKELKDFTLSSRMSSLTLKGLSEIVEKKSVAIVDSKLDDTLQTIMETLQESSELILFMKETADEDIRLLIDFVEDHSDQFVSEATVSDLIDVHGFLKNFLKATPQDPVTFLESMKNHCNKLEKKVEMAAKIKECSCNVHSLRWLYRNLAKRGEMTKEIISNALKKGCYHVEAKPEGSCDVQLSYRRQEGATKETTYSMAELLDLRSRALLIVNTDKKQEKMRQSDDCDAATTSVNLTLSAFTKQVEMITAILNTVALLQESGHPNYEKCCWELHSSEEIESLAETLKLTLKKWEALLSRLQEEHYFLNFFHPDQLWMLKKFFSTSLLDIKEDHSLKMHVHSLLRFVDPCIQCKDLDNFHCLYKGPKENAGFESDLRAVGRVLDEIFSPQQTAKFEIKVPQRYLDKVVQRGKLFVAYLEHGSKQTAHVVMSLFENTTGSYPQPSQVLFCHSETSWEEVERLLKRSFEAHKHATDVKLHCLANVENLSNDIQFELVASIRAYQESVKGPYLLSIVCCGGNHHHIVDQFSTAARNVIGMSEAQLRGTLQKDFPEVFIVTSDIPGVGKTEAIYEHAASRKKTPVTIPISGPLSRNNLVKKLSGLHVCPHECIHFDVGEVDDPSVLDTLMFELIVVGMVSSGTELFHLPTKHVYIEIANTLGRWLQDSLPVTKCFSPLHIQLDGFKNLVVSQEPLSPIQVVCQYLHAYESGLLESKSIHPAKMKPLSPECCKELLSKHFSSTDVLSYNIVDSFIKVFSDQLLQFSASPYFKPHNLKVALGPSHDVRNCLFKALLEVSRDFASRSVVTCKDVQSKTITKEQAPESLKKIQLQSRNFSGEMVDRVKEMIQWADNNHLVIVFHSLEALTISALYCHLSLVPLKVQGLLKSQTTKGKGMEDFRKLNHNELQLKLDQIVGRTPGGNNDSLQPLDYALTPDNVLKMVLIIQRVKAGIPIIIMGETGCGKTSLVRYLARTCGIPFYVFNFHAGVTEEKLVDFVHKTEKEAKSAGKDVWVFLDEINTCEYLGTINEMICHRSIRGKPLTPNLVFIAACNPYRKRPLEKLLTDGLSGKTKTDEYSELVYRVHSLPETMIDFVWDYGSLNKKDEHAYIGRMVEGIVGSPNSLLVDLLCTSQEYIRKQEDTPYCVSLRDVHRCIVLVKWFQEILPGRQELSLSQVKSYLKYHEIARGFSIQKRSFVLALAHCYQSRLPTADSRRGYRQHVSQCFRKHENQSFEESSFEAIVRAEQEDYLERMELPEGTAKNAALRENVFVMLVCILKRIPVFVVGKPGCSKSLSMQIIRSNLRGKDSKDPFLKTLPQLYVVSHQGSESSTSDGILKVFEKAGKYKEHNKSGNVLPVVLLDEIGLAEVSKYNPLKVLHNLLEPGGSTFPDVAVVGISNWALDAAKMNRAIHLSRPEPDVDDLFETGKSLRDAHLDKTSFGTSRTFPDCQFYGGTYPDDKQLRCLAEAYYEYQRQQRYANFHGLRDYYNLIKSLSKDTRLNTPHSFFSDEKTKEIQHALQRNFGGVPNDVNNFQTLFQKGLHSLDLIEEEYHFPVTQLICDNLHDKLARHLMIITNGDSAIGILDQTLQSLEKEKITIFGSRFEEDLSEEYNYRMLSRIILCMERDCVLILRDLESIYGSLYDMLNQNYTVVGGKRNCRVALGPFSNPMCQVHDGFRCVVLIDQASVDYTDPPFLNRFEKQVLRFSDVLNVEQRKIISSLNDWVTGISTIPDFESQFHRKDMFVGFCEDTLPSLVLKNSQDAMITKDDILEKCKQDLMLVASPDGVVRSLESSLAKTNFEEVQTFYDNFFQKPLHNGLKEYLKYLLDNPQLEPEQSKDVTSGERLLIMTHSNIHVNVSQCLEGLLHCQTEKLSAFKSEKHLTKQLERFWRSCDSLLVLQCKPELDATHMLLAKSIIEQQRQKYIKEATEEGQKQKKHVCIVVHVQRESEGNEVQSQRWQFSFLSGWTQVTIDVLEHPVVPVTACLDVSIKELLETKALSFVDVASKHFLWCLTRIKYSAIHQPTVDTIVQLENLLRSTPKILECFEELVKRWLQKRDQSNSHQPDARSWQFSVACDRQALINSLHLLGAIQRHVSHLIRQPLAKIVYFLEKESAWPQFLFTQDPSDEEELDVWSELILDQEILNIDDIPDQQELESYFVSGRRLQLTFPCASIFCKKVEQVQHLFSEVQRELLLNETNLDENGELCDTAAESQLYRFANIVKETIPQVIEMDYLQRNVACYVEDLLDIKTARFSSEFTRAERVEFIKSAMAHNIKFRISGDPARLITRLHSLFWLNESSYMAALQVYQTCHKVKHVELGEVSSGFIAVFEKELFQNNNPTENDPLEDAQDTEWGLDCETSEDADVNGRVNNSCNVAHTSAAVGVNSAGVSQEENTSKLQQCKQGDEKNEKETIGTETTEKGVNEEIRLEEVNRVTSEHLPREFTEAENAVQKPVSFDEVLVETLCSALFPTFEVINGFNGPEGWQRTASFFLSTVSRMQVESPPFHFLSACYDFVTLLLLPESLEKVTLYKLCELGKFSESYLDSQDIFDFITDVVDKLAKRGVQQGRLEDFLMLYYGRCIDANPDTPVLGSILASIVRSGKRSLLRLAGPLIHRVFLDEEHFCSGVFEKLLHSLESINQHPGLQEISYALSTLPDDADLDNPFAVVCCDLITEVAFLNIDMSTISSSENESLLSFQKAFQTLTAPCKGVEHGVFQLLCAAAYLKSFLASLSKFILQRRQCLVKDGEFSVLMNEINAAFASTETNKFRSRVLGLQMYFLKELKKELSMYEIREVCQKSCKLSALKSIEWQDECLVGKLSFDPFQSCADNSQAQAALATALEKKNLKPLEDAINSMARSVKKRFEMAAVLTKSFYLVRSRRSLKDSEDKAIDHFSKTLHNMEAPYIELLLRITGRKDFRAPRLCISPESLPADVHRATLILHLCIILASSFRSAERTIPAFMSYFNNPMASNGSYVLASGESSTQPCAKHYNYHADRFAKSTSLFCSCGRFFVMAGKVQEATCPSCRSECKAEKARSQLAEEEHAILASKGYVPLLSGDIFLHVRQLRPAEFRILHLFVHATFYGGFALELFDDDCLSQFMGSDAEDNTPSEVCFQQIVNDLAAMCSLLDAKEEDIIRLLHCVLEQTASILTSADLCYAQDARLSWERKFAEAVKPLLREFHPRKLLERSKDYVSKSLLVQRKIEETDSPQFSDTAERNMNIPRLLRTTLPKTFNSVRAYYMTAGDEERGNHPLLGLFLDFNDSLPLVAHLAHLVSWSRTVDSLLSRRISRKETTTKIGDVIRREAKSPEERKRLNEAFENFSTAFENMRPILKERMHREVPYLSESSPISLCLVENRDQGVFLCAALQVLQEIQNDFLRRVLSIAATRKCTALIFLEKDEGKSAIPMVHLQEAREKEIIQYLWSDDILRHSQRNTEYGHGREVFFDLSKIEKEMSVRFLVGKAFLSTFDGLHEFIFSRELFHTCRGILDELQELIPQQPLSDVLRIGLERQSEHSLESVQDLLEHMEIVLCLLKRHQVGKPEEALTDFTDKWLCGPRPFPKALLPQPHGAIQLTHVVALYEFLEDMLAESAAKRVHDVYRSAIPKEITDDMAAGALVSGETDSDRSALNAITTALRRFIFRYLSPDEMVPEPGDSLVERMSERSLWPIDMFQSPKVELSTEFITSAFPANLTIAHTFQVLCFYQDRLKVLQEARQAVRSPASRGSRPADQRSRKGKARFGFS